MGVFLLLLHLDCKFAVSYFPAPQRQQKTKKLKIRKLRKAPNVPPSTLKQAKNPHNPLYIKISWHYSKLN